MNNLSEMSVEVATELLYWCGKERKGSNFLIQNLVDKIEAVAGDAAEMESDLLTKIVIAFNMVGRSGTALRQFSKAASGKKSELDPQVYKLVK